MMNCQRIESALLAVLDGRATPAEREQAAGHIAECADCARRMESLRGTWTALDHLPAIEPSPLFDARLRARLAAEVAAPRPRWFAWPLAHLRLVALAAGLVAVTAAWYSYRPSPGLPAPAQEQSQQDFAVVKNLPVLENYDVLSNFDALTALPGAQQDASQAQPVE
jgi:anti-sigma factor RsiW